MDDLITFLNARLDEDEATAKAASRFNRWHVEPWYGFPGEHERADVWGNAGMQITGNGALDVEDARHIARQDPARALREVAAKRAILAEHAPQPFYGNNPPPLRDQAPENAEAWYCGCQCPDGIIESTYPCETVRALAAVYGDHPDYRGDWVP